MVQVTACPGDPQLRQIVSGRATPEVGEAFAVHLEQCPSCAERMEAMLAGDTLLEAMAAQATVTDLPHNPAVPSLIERLLSMQPGAAPANAPTGAALDATLGFGHAAPVENFDFLAPPQAPDEIGRLGNYRVLQLLGSGGMGLVFQAEDVHLKRKVALKVMRPEAAAKSAAKDRFLREAQAAAAIEHEHIVTIHQVGEERGMPFLAMQWLKGASLQDWLDKGGPVKAIQVARVGRQIALGLAAAHEQGLIHRDIKPANIWIESGPGGRVKILDFGLARGLADDVQLTQSGVILGTPAYMAPEQARGDRVDPRCDLFSLGVILYRMATGRAPFSGSTTMAVLSSLALDTPEAPRRFNADVPSDLSDLIMQLLAKEPAQRPASAREVAERLLKFSRPVEARPAEAPAPAPITNKKAPPAVAVARPTAARPATARPTALPAQTLPAARKPRRSWVVIAAGVAAIAVVVAAATVYYLQTPNGTVRIEINDDNIQAVLTKNGAVIKGADKSGDITVAAGEQTLKVKHGDLEFETDKFILKKGATVTLKIELLPGKIQVVHDGKVIGEKGLPIPPPQARGDADRKGAEWVLSINGRIKIHVNGQDRDIAAVADLPKEPFRLVWINCASNLQATDAGMANLKGCTGLKHLDLNNSPFTDAGLANLDSCNGLTYLDLSATAVTSAGLVNFKECIGLTHLNLGLTAIQGPGLSAFKGCKKIEYLNLRQTNVAEEGLESFAGCSGITHLQLFSTPVTDAGLKNFKACTGLKYLNLSATPVTDAGLAHFKDCNDLAELDLSNTKVASPGMANFKGCKGLTHLDLHNTRVTNEGLANFKACAGLKELSLNGTAIGDEGLAHFQECKRLTALKLGNSQAGDEGLAHFKDCKELMIVWLYGTRVGDAALAHLRGCTNLEDLNMSETLVTDAGLAHLKNLTKLKQLRLYRTAISDAGLESLAVLPSLEFLELSHARVSLHGFDQLKAAMPRGTINWSETNRSIAEQILKLGGSVDIGMPGKEAKPVKSVDELPSTFFQVRRVSLKGIKQGGELSGTLEFLRFAEFDRLQALDLSGADLRGFGFLKSIHGLEELTLADMGLTDENMAAVPKLPGLRKLVLDGNPMSGRAVDMLAEWPKLTDLSLGCPNFADLFAKHLAMLKQLERLSLAGSGVTDAGLKHLHGLTNLKELNLSGAKVSPESVSALEKALPDCKVKR